MNILIHDIEKNIEENIFKHTTNDMTVISDNNTIHPCVCCFGCWIKTPGQCVIHDGYDNMGLLFSKCGRLIIVSRCFYGGYSPFVHTVLDRSIPCLLPYFETRNGETHHKTRYDHNIALTVYFYGKLSEHEKETASKLVLANAANLSSKKAEVFFYDRIEDLKEVL